MSKYLTKSDFKACVDCRTKLFYRKNKYPSNLEDNEYLQFLADGGFMVEFVAKAAYPEGIDLAAERDPSKAFAETRRLLDQGDSVLFEAAAIAGKYHVRTDILRRVGNTLHLIEIKSASLEVDEAGGASPFLTKKGLVASKWKEYLMDVAFQSHVLGRAFPEFTVRPHLCVVNKSHRATPWETMAHFALHRDPVDAKARPSVIYSGDIAELKNTKLLITHEVSVEVAKLLPEVLTKAERLAELIDANGKVRRVQEDIAEFYKICRNCDYRLGDDAPDGAKNGFRECWGDMADARPHVLDLHRVGQIGTAKVFDPLPGLLRRKRASLLDLAEHELGKEGIWQERRHMQWSHSADGGTEQLPSALIQELKAHQTNPGWPLHFIDFEACDISLPHHAGLRPYERVAFEWSCHTLDATGNLSHSEWLNTSRDLPNFAFAQSLRNQIGEQGTVYVWSGYEQTTLQRVLTQIGEWTQADPAEALRLAGLPDLTALHDLAGWIDRLLGHEDERGKRHESPRIRDLHAMALRYYFHPLMLGRTSIKVVLPAVWRESAKLRNDLWFSKYLKIGADGEPLDPYKTLEPLPLGEDDEDEDAVREGTGAIRVYQDLIFDLNCSSEIRVNRETLLKQYCELDTAAMAMIWKHWSFASEAG
jgi:hypothetical protein